MTDITNELIAIPREDVIDMMQKLEQITLMTSDEPQSMANDVYNQLRKSLGHDDRKNMQGAWHIFNKTGSATDG
jgi:hypothetical protein